MTCEKSGGTNSFQQVWELHSHSPTSFSLKISVLNAAVFYFVNYFNLCSHQQSIEGVIVHVSQVSFTRHECAWHTEFQSVELLSEMVIHYLKKRHEVHKDLSWSLTLEDLRGAFPLMCQPGLAWFDSTRHFPFEDVS